MIIIRGRGDHNKNDLLRCDSHSRNGTVFSAYFCFCFTKTRCCLVLYQPIKWPAADDSYRYTIHDSPHPFPFNNTDILLLNMPQERTPIANIKHIILQATDNKKYMHRQTILMAKENMYDVNTNSAPSMYVCER